VPLPFQSWGTNSCAVASGAIARANKSPFAEPVVTKAAPHRLLAGAIARDDDTQRAPTWSHCARGTEHRLQTGATARLVPHRC